MIEASSAQYSGTTVSDYIAHWLHRQGISSVFTLPGGMIAALLDAIDRQGHTRIVTMHHEQAVAFAADGVGRFAGTPGVAMATAGPGATNMLTAIASAYLDSIPAIFLVGQVQSYLLKGDRTVRQFGFQECDVIAMARPVTKAAWQVTDADAVPAVLDRAMTLVLSGRPGPVLIELPADIQTKPLPPNSPVGTAAHADPVFVDTPVSTNTANTAAVKEMLDALARAQRPVALIGGGVHAAHAAARCRAFLHTLGVPAAASVMALDALPADDPLRLGMIGMYGNRWVNHAVFDADFVLALGSKLDFGTIGADVAGWGRTRTVFQVDCDPGEMRRIRHIRPIVADLGEFLDVALPIARSRELPGHAEWTAHLAAQRKRWPDTEELAGCPGINPNVLIQQLSLTSAAAAAFVIDEGQHLWWACQSIQPGEGQRFLPALGLGPCGWAFPAAIGVTVAAGRPVVLVAGDGAFQFNIQELQTVVRNWLPVKIVIMDNGCHGSVRQLQEQVFGGRYPSTVRGYDAPDFARVAGAYGIPSCTVSEPDEVTDALRWLWQDPASPALLHVQISQDLNVYPNVPFGAPINMMQAQPRTSASVPEVLESS